MNQKCENFIKIKNLKTVFAWRSYFSNERMYLTVSILPDSHAECKIVLKIQVIYNSIKYLF